MNKKDDVHAAISQKTGESRAVIDSFGFELQRDPYYECPIDWDLADAQRNVSLIWQRPTQHTV